MRGGDRRRLAQSATALCLTIMPRERRAWAEAMKAEAEAIEDPRAALSYAFGCVFACGKERMLNMNSIEKSAHLAFPAAMLILSGFTARGAWRSFMVDPATALVFGLLAAVLAMTALWSLWRGPRALVQAASFMLVAHLIALFAMAFSPVPAERWANFGLFQALAFEGLFIWGALLLGGLWLMDRQRQSAS
jgi:hypothetical protein